MTKRNRVNDTVPMLGRPVPPVDATDPVGSATLPLAPHPLDVTEPVGAGDPTDPGPPPTFNWYASNESNTPVPSAEDMREAKELIDGFKNRPLRPPAPKPKRRAQSDGGDFVAYHAVGRPAPRTPEDAKQQALVEIARIASSPDPSTPPVAQRDVATYVGVSRRRRWGVLQMVAVVVLVVAVGGVSVAILTRGSRPAPQPAAASSPTIASVAVPAVPPTAGALPVASSAPAPEMSPAPAASPLQVAPRAPAGAPTRTAKPRIRPELNNW